MSTSQQSLFDEAVALLDAGDTQALRGLLQANPELATARDPGNATLLVRLIDWPGHRPQAPDSARVLLEAGAEVDARRNDENGTALGGALCTQEVEVIRVLLEFGADVSAPLGWMPGTPFDLADHICQNLERQGDEPIVALAEMISQAAGRPIPSRVALGGTIPLLFVRDVDAGLKFYTERLGFRLDWSYDSDCGKYACVSRGKAEFHVTVCQCDDQRHLGNLWVRVAAGPVDPLYEEFQAAGVKILVEPTTRPYGFRELEIEDADGNRLTFAGPVPEERQT